MNYLLVWNYNEMWKVVKKYKNKKDLLKKMKKLESEVWVNDGALEIFNLSVYQWSETEGWYKSDIF